jgi:adenylate cyclase
VPPQVMAYANVLVETSIPTLGVLIAAGVLPPADVLFLPVVFLYFLFIQFTILRLRFWLAVFAGAVASIEYLWVAWRSLNGPGAEKLDDALTNPATHAAKAALLLLGGLAAGFIARQLGRLLEGVIASRSERQRVVEMFGRHVSPSVVEHLLSRALPLDGEDRAACVMFLDVRGFTEYSNNRPAAEVFRYLNTLFAGMAEVVGSHGGMINKFLGDGFMAVFGAPVGSGREVHEALAAARDLLAHVERLNATASVAVTRIGIGLHAGKVVAGVVGSSDRHEYTVIGEVVNLASRIEAMNKTFGSQLLVSEQVYEVAKKGVGEAVDLGDVEIRGLERPMRLFRLA